MIELSQKEYEWLSEKAGYISASKLDDLLTSGKKGNSWGQTAITYLYKLQYERLRGFPIVGVDARPMSFGRENEVYANEWLRENVNQAIRSCSTDFEERIFKKVPSRLYASTVPFFVNTLTTSVTSTLKSSPFSKTLKITSPSLINFKSFWFCDNVTEIFCFIFLPFLCFPW